MRKFDTVFDGRHDAGVLHTSTGVLANLMRAVEETAYVPMSRVSWSSYLSRLRPQMRLLLREYHKEYV